MRKMIIPIFVPHLGCPHDCVFCNQKKISGTLKPLSVNDIRKQIKDYIESAEDAASIEIAFYGGSFTGIDFSVQEELLSTANEFINEIDGIRVSTRPDFINERIIANLKKYNVKTVELGVQSMNNTVLEKSSRGHTAEDVAAASELIKRSGIELGIQTMPGLPGAERIDDIDTAREVIKLKPSIVRIYPTLVIRDTYLQELYNKGLYRPLELNDAVEITADLMDLYESNNITVIRVGLQPTENVTESSNGGDVIAGPFHPAFRQLVDSLRVYRIIKDKLKLINAESETLTISAGNYDISAVIGNRKDNIKKLKSEYGFKDVIVYANKVKADIEL